MVALDDELQRVTERRRALQGDGLAADDAELQEPPAHRGPAADPEDAAGLAAAEPVERDDGGRGRALSPAALRDRPPKGEGARQEPAGAMRAVLIGELQVPRPDSSPRRNGIGRDLCPQLEGAFRPQVRMAWAPPSGALDDA